MNTLITDQSSQVLGDLDQLRCTLPAINKENIREEELPASLDTGQSVVDKDLLYACVFYNNTHVRK